jgi:CHAT domain-containing protein/Tfp pilus assembly protein PilF
LGNLAGVYRELGRYAEAEPLLKRALAIDERVSGPDHPEVASDLSSLALLYHVQERYPEAESLYRRALDIRERALGDHPDTALTLGNLASLMAEQGRLDEAEPLLRRALAVTEKALGSNHPDTGYSANSLAVTYRALGRRDEARVLLERALAIFERALGPDHPNTAMALNNLGEVYCDAGRLAECEAMFERVLSILGKFYPEDHPRIVGARANLAGTYILAERYPLAEAEFRKALASLERALPSDHPQIGMASYWLSRSLREQGKSEEAFLRGRRAVDILAAAKARAAARVLSGGWQDRFVYDHVFGLQVRNAYALSIKRPQEAGALRAEAFEAAQRVAFDDTARAVANTAARFAAGRDDLANLLREQQTKIAQLAALDRRLAGVLGSSQPEVRAQATLLRRESEALSARLRDIDGILRREHTAYGDLAIPKPTSIAATQALLAPDEAVVLFLPLPEATVAFAVSSTQVDWAVSPGPIADLSQRIAALRRQLEPDRWQSSMMPFDRALAHRLYRDLWAPVESVVKDKAHVFVIPTGPLTSLPLSVLVAEAPGGGAAGDADPAVLRQTAWLAKRHALATLPSLSSLKALRVYAGRKSATEAFAGFGDPAFDERIATRQAPHGSAEPVAASPVDMPVHRFPLIGSPHTFFSGETRARLSLSGGEGFDLRLHRSQALAAVGGVAAPLSQPGTRSVASVFRGTEPNLDEIRRLPPLPAAGKELRALAEALGAAEGDVYLRERATEARLKSLDLSRKRVIAFATHGMMAGDLGLGEPGLVFTPPAAASALDDGYLAASEAAGLNLTADWIILSACNTAAGDVPGAKGLSGLARAFFLAGAKSLLVSHWSVWDDAAERLTTETVRNFQANPQAGRAQALRQSMLSLMNDASAPRFAHPAAWAPFVVAGETRAR